MEDCKGVASTPHPPPLPPLLSASGQFFSVFLCVASQPTDGRGGKGAGVEPNLRPEESLAPNKLFNTPRKAIEKGYTVSSDLSSYHSQGAVLTPPPPVSAAKAGRNHLND
jgi:hypothetical protein